MSLASPPRPVGALLRDWRQRRRMSQLDLSVEAEVSSRHLSFVETGRSRPSRELLLHLAEHLDVPLRDRNALLLAAGYAPVFRQTALEADEMSPVRTALHKILGAHEPFPAVIVDRRWDLVLANRPALNILSDGVSPTLLAPPANALRVSLHPDGLAPRIRNLPEYSAHVMSRLHRQAAVSGDPELHALWEELRRYPGVHEEPPEPPGLEGLLFVPLHLETSPGQEISLFSTIATFGTALDITVAELAIESFFPADAKTDAALRAAVGA